MDNKTHNNILIKKWRNDMKLVESANRFFDEPQKIDENVNTYSAILFLTNVELTNPMIHAMKAKFDNDWIFAPEYDDKTRKNFSPNGTVVFHKDDIPDVDIEDYNRENIGEDLIAFNDVTDENIKKIKGIAPKEETLDNY